MTATQALSVQRPQGSRWFARILIVVWLAVAGTALVSGLEYYALPIAERAFDPLHELWAPTGTIGHTFGLVGTLMMVVGVILYTARKRIHGLRRIGKLKAWLEFHVFLCTLGPFLVVLHTSFKFGGIVSISLWSMVIVVVSGVFGRYVYAWIPKTMNGQFLTAEAIAREQRAHVEELARLTELAPERLRPLLAGAGPNGSRGLVRSVSAAAGYRLALPRRRRRIRSSLEGYGVPEARVSRALELTLEQHRIQTQIAVLRPFLRLFRYWHVIHLPLALLMLVVAAIHIAVVAMLGYGWVL